MVNSSNLSNSFCPILVIFLSDPPCTMQPLALFSLVLVKSLTLILAAPVNLQGFTKADVLKGPLAVPNVGAPIGRPIHATPLRAPFSYDTQHTAHYERTGETIFTSNFPIVEGQNNGRSNPGRQNTETQHSGPETHSTRPNAENAGGQSNSQIGAEQFAEHNGGNRAGPKHKASTNPSIGNLID
jgi:hypothetical protein